MKKLITFFVAMCFAVLSISQVTSVSYVLDYDTTQGDTSFYDCKILIASGSATMPADRIQFNSQYSFVIPTGNTLEVVESFMPLQNNLDYSGFEPIDWDVSNIANCDSLLENHYYVSVIPSLIVMGSYNNLMAGDTITLFRVSIIGDLECPFDVRLFENGVDPSLALSCSEQEFSNGFTVGGVTQLYSGNAYPSNFEDDIEITLDDAVSCEGVLSPNLGCAPFTGLSYLWSTGETTQSISVNVETEEEFSLTVSGPNGYEEVFAATVRDIDHALANDGDVEFCVGDVIDLGISSGFLVSSNLNIIIGGLGGEITAIAPGQATITYIDDVNGCTGEMNYTVLSPPAASLGVDTSICVGQTTQLLSDDLIGAWTSANPIIATVLNDGTAAGISAGTTTFVFTSNEDLCESNPTEALTVHPKPIITLDENQICIGQTTFASSNTFGGTWTTDNASIAVINAVTGEITAISNGSTIVTYYDGFTGCAGTSEILLVNPEIQTEILGSDQICVGGTTQLSPSTGGLWTSNDNDVAIVTNTGLVTGIDNGVVVFTFQDTVTFCNNGVTDIVTVGNIQGIANVGTDDICIGATTQLSPNAGGVWNSADYAVAINDENGEITGVGEGVTFFSFETDLPNCEVVGDDIEVSVNKLPIIALAGPDRICIGETTIIETNGDLEQVELGSTTYTNGGVITGVVSGISEYYATNGEGCSSDTIEVVVEEDVATFFLGPDYICGNDVTFVSPSVGGAWSTSDGFVATVNNNGLVTAIGPGQTDLIFTPSSTGCPSTHVLTVVVGGVVTTSIDEVELCPGSQTQAYPSTGGTWATTNPNVATVDNSGVVTGISSGVAGVIFTPAGSSCDSYPLEVTILATPLIEAASSVCISESAEIEVLNGSDINVVGPSVNNTHMITNVGDGLYQVDFIELGIYMVSSSNEAGCSTQVSIEVTNSPIIEPASSPTMYVGDTLEIFSPDELEVLLVNDNTIASVVGLTSLVGIAPGEVEVYAFGAYNLCLSNSITITVLSNDPCQDADTTGDPVIIGSAYIDDNGNGIWDEEESPLSNVMVTTEPGGFSILTDNNGQYQLSLEEGMYNVIAQVNEGIWESNVLTLAIDIEDPCTSGFDFGFVPVDTSLPMANISMVNTIARCDWETRFDITVENTGVEELDALIQFTFDEQTTLFSSDLINIQVNNNVVSGDVQGLAPLTSKKYKVTVKMPGGSSNLPMLDFEVKLVSLSGIEIDSYKYTEQLLCSYDPNDKRSYPDREGGENLTLMDEDVEYTIRFQNNGNDTAFQVKIVDRLDPNINPSTIRLVSASHNVETCIEGADLIFLFEDILLVDSATNYNASQGYVTFRCNMKEGREEMTPVHNQADIIFDTNDPIITNQTLNTLVSVLCSDKETFLEMSICEGDTYGGYDVSGTYMDVYDLPFGCDSVVILTLDVQGITYTQQELTLCTGEAVLINNTVYTIEEDVIINDTLYNESGCISNVQVYDIDVIQDVFAGIDDINACVGETMNLTIPVDGEWSSSDESIISIDENGTIISVGSGNASLEFINAETGCISYLNAVINDIPEIENIGQSELCIDGTSALVTSNLGTWIVDDEAIISVSNDGVVTGLSTGITNVVFTDSDTGCFAYLEIEVLDENDEACLVSTTEISDDAINIYPNPVSEVLLIESNLSWESISMINIEGKVIHRASNPSINLQINVNDYVNGVYLLVFENSEYVVTKRFVKN